MPANSKNWFTGGRHFERSSFEAVSAVTFAVLTIALMGASMARAQYPSTYPSSPQVVKDGTAVLIEDYASAPLSSALLPDKSKYPPPIDFHGELGRVNSLRAEPSNAPMSATRFFVDDSNGSLYTLDKNSKKFTPYLNFVQIFPRFTTEPGYAGGIVSLAFDPGYAKNGRFYTVHTEKPSDAPSAAPGSARTPNLTLEKYAVTPTVKPPVGDVVWESVLVEWTDTDVRNATFEGSAREILRVGFPTFFHQMDDLVFNPTAQPGQDDYGNLYISIGDGRSGETPGASHTFPQQLNTVLGKILRITPDVSLRPKDQLSTSGAYRIPSAGADANPFVSVNGARAEIFAYGLRNPHRLTWDAATKTLIADDIGLHSWEEINVITKGANYGYAEREGNEVVLVDKGGVTGSQVKPPSAFPIEDLLVVEGLEKPVAPVYPAAVYSHQEGDSISSGFVYRGKLMPQLAGKYIFGDITTARVFYTDLGEMLAGHGARGKQAAIHEIQLMYKSPYNSNERAPVPRRLYDIVADAFAHKEGLAAEGANRSVLPGASGVVGGVRNGNYQPSKADPYGVPYGGGRADVRLAVGGDNEIYVLSKSDGFIRKLTAVVTPPPSK